MAVLEGSRAFSRHNFWQPIWWTISSATPTTVLTAMDQTRPALPPGRTTAPSVRQLTSRRNRKCRRAEAACVRHSGTKYGSVSVCVLHLARRRANGARAPMETLVALSLLCPVSFFPLFFFTCYIMFRLSNMPMLERDLRAFLIPAKTSFNHCLVPFWWHAQVQFTDLDDVLIVERAWALWNSLMTLNVPRDRVLAIVPRWTGLVLESTLRDIGYRSGRSGGCELCANLRLDVV